MTDFAAIDFETANEQPSSVCSVGVVIVRGGQIVDSFYSLIHPEPEYYQWFCQRVHGLGPEDTDGAPVFPYVWEKIAPLVEGLPLVAHNSRFDEGTIASTTPSPPRGAVSATASQIISCRRLPRHAASTWRTIITPWPMPRPVRI